MPSEETGVLPQLPSESRTPGLAVSVITQKNCKWHAHWKADGQAKVLTRHSGMPEGLTCLRTSSNWSFPTSVRNWPSGKITFQRLYSIRSRGSSIACSTWANGFAPLPLHAMCPVSALIPHKRAIARTARLERRHVNQSIENDRIGQTGSGRVLVMSS